MLRRCIDLPIDKPRPPVQTYNGAHHRLHLSAELSTQLRELSRRHGATLFMTLLAVFDASVSLCGTDRLSARPSRIAPSETERLLASS